MELTTKEKIIIMNKHMLTSGNTELSDEQIRDINGKLWRTCMASEYTDELDLIEHMQTVAERLYNELE